MAMKEATPAGGAAAFVSDEDIAVDKDGKVVAADSKEAVTLVASKGVPISRERARAFGLIEDDVSRAQKAAAEEQKKRADADRAAATSTADRTEIIVGRTAPVAKSATPAEDKSAAKTEDKSAGTPSTTPSSTSSSEPPKA